MVFLYIKEASWSTNYGTHQIYVNFFGMVNSQNGQIYLKFFKDDIFGHKLLLFSKGKIYIL